VSVERLRRLVPPALRTAVKGALRSAGLLDERARAIGLRRVYADDTFLVSYPRSGNSWVRFLLGHLLAPGEALTFQTIHAVVPDIHRHRAAIDRMARPRYVKSHVPAYASYPRMVYVYRDGRDAMVSFFHYETGRGRFQGSFGDFLRSRRPRLFGRWTWDAHVSAALGHAEVHPGRTCLVRFEDLLQDPARELRRLAGFCGLAAGDGAIASAIERSSFGRLRSVEREEGNALDRGAVTFIRSGVAGEWRAYFSVEDRRYFHELAGPTLRRLGYAVEDDV
jgi:hypothetical protein